MATDLIRKWFSGSAEALLNGQCPVAPMVSRPSKVDASAEYDGGVKNFPDTGRNITFDPVTSMTIDLANKESRARFFNRFASGGQPVYVIGATNNMDGNFNDVTRDTYITLRMKGMRAARPVDGSRWSSIQGHHFYGIWNKT